jgi:hypothetical protein
MSPPEMRENRPLLDKPASVGTFVQPTAGEVAEVTERTALLTKKEQHSAEHKKDAHFRNIDGRGFWILFSTIIFVSSIPLNGQGLGTCVQIPRQASVSVERQPVATASRCHSHLTPA